MPSQLGFFGPESFYDSSQINMYLGDDKPMDTGPEYFWGGSQYFDERAGDYIRKIQPYPEFNAVEEYQNRQPPNVSLEGGMLLSPHDVQNSKISAMAFDLAGVPQISGGQLSDQGNQMVSAAMGEILVKIQQKMDSGQNYDEAVESVYADQGAPPPAPRRGGGGAEPWKCATGCSNWHADKCKSYGAPRGCDLDEARKNHRDKNRGSFCPVPN